MLKVFPLKKKKTLVSLLALVALIINVITIHTSASCKMSFACVYITSSSVAFLRGRPWHLFQTRAATCGGFCVEMCCNSSAVVIIGSGENMVFFNFLCGTEC